MKKFLIEPGNAPEGYSEYENQDKTLKQEIIDFKNSFELKEIEINWEDWTVDGRDGTDYKLVKGRDVKYITEEEYLEYTKDVIDTVINEKFITGDNFSNSFGPLFNLNSDDNKVYNLNILNIKKGYGWMSSPDRQYTNSDLNVYDHIFVYNIDTYDGIHLKFGVTKESTFLQFNSDGNYVNRDYNLDLNKYSQDQIEPNIVLDSFYNQIKETVKGDIKVNSDGSKFYTKDLFIQVYKKENTIGLEFVKARNEDSYQKCSGYPIYKRPKNLKLSNIEELLNKVKSMFTVEDMKWFDLEYCLNY